MMRKMLLSLAVLAALAFVAPFAMAGPASATAFTENVNFGKAIVAMPLAASAQELPAIGGTDNSRMQPQYMRKASYDLTSVAGYKQVAMARIGHTDTDDPGSTLQP